MARHKIETPDEEAIIDAVEQGDYVSLPDSALQSMASELLQAAQNTTERLSRRKAISIRLLEDDIVRLKAMALHEGMPYQTYISHLIHKITTGQIRF
jgi:predicted DNA binding CopG/RHH family protein